VKMPTRFTSAEGKRFFVRLFNTLQLNMHFISRTSSRWRPAFGRSLTRSTRA
jgi:hypothetical protein